MTDSSHFRFPVPVLFKTGQEDEHGSTDIDVLDKEKNERKPVLICSSCGNLITYPETQIEISGSHLHTFFNPAGIVFELACFSTAQGCAALGDPSDEFTWFPGFYWRVALCKGCGEHLGWKFTSGESYFWGLIRNKLRSGEK